MKQIIILFAIFFFVVVAGAATTFFLSEKNEAMLRKSYEDDLLESIYSAAYRCFENPIIRSLSFTSAVQEITKQELIDGSVSEVTATAPGNASLRPGLSPSSATVYDATVIHHTFFMIPIAEIRVFEVGVNVPGSCERV